MLADAALAGEERPAVAFVDLDHFKLVNDRFGHAAGDAVLRAAAQRIRRSVRAGDVAARLGGDEFAILFTGSSPRDAAVTVAERVRSSLADPFAVDGAAVDVGGSVGLAFAAPESNVDDLLRRADAAMYSAKNTGKGRLVIDPPAPPVGRIEAVTMTPLGGPLPRGGGEQRRAGG